MVAIDGRSPKFDGGIVTRLDCISLGIVVNNKGELTWKDRSCQPVSSPKSIQSPKR